MDNKSLIESLEYFLEATKRMKNPKGTGWKKVRAGAKHGALAGAAIGGTTAAGAGTAVAHFLGARGPGPIATGVRRAVQVGLGTLGAAKGAVNGAVIGSAAGAGKHAYDKHKWNSKHPRNKI